MTKKSDLTSRRKIKANTIPASVAGAATKTAPTRGANPHRPHPRLVEVVEQVAKPTS